MCFNIGFHRHRFGRKKSPSFSSASSSYSSSSPSSRAFLSEDDETHRRALPSLPCVTNAYLPASSLSSTTSMPKIDARASSSSSSSSPKVHAFSQRFPVQSFTFPSLSPVKSTNTPRSSCLDLLEQPHSIAHAH